MGNQLVDLVIIADNAPCHRSLENMLTNTPAKLLRWAPYSPMLNPIESIWSKVKTYVKGHLGIPEVTPPGVVEQRLVHFREHHRSSKEYNWWWCLCTCSTTHHNSSSCCFSNGRYASWLLNLYCTILYVLNLTFLKYI